MSDIDRTSDTTVARIYEIRVRGVLAPRWSAWFDGMTIDTATADGTTAIRGPIVDQAALHGLLHKLRDVGIPLVSLTEISPAPTTANPNTYPNTTKEP